MPVFICNDPIKRQNPWAAEKHRSMTAEFARHRIPYYEISSPEELRAHLDACRGEHSSIIFYPMGDADLRYLFTRYGEFDVHKIVFAHHDVNIASINFSSIISDFYGDMKLAITHLTDKGCRRIALFHANPDSYHDRMRIETYKQLVPHPPLLFNASSGRVYPTLKKLMQCREKIDAVICINDYMAFCFMLLLDSLDRDWRKKLSVLSFSDTILSGLHTPSLSSISLNYGDAGKEIVTIHKTLEKHERVAYMHLIMKSRLAARQTTELENPAGMVFSDYPKISEEECKTIVAPLFKCASLEKMLAACDSVDFKILHGLLLSRPLSEIESDVFLSQSAVKHRIRKYKSTLKFETANDLAAWLRLWIDPQKLKEKNMGM